MGESCGGSALRSGLAGLDRYTPLPIRAPVRYDTPTPDDGVDLPHIRLAPTKCMCELEPHAVRCDAEHASNRFDGRMCIAHETERRGLSAWGGHAGESSTMGNLAEAMRGWQTKKPRNALGYGQLHPDDGRGAVPKMVGG